MTFEWSPIGTSEDETGGYPITSYQLLSTKYPSTASSVWTFVADTAPGSTVFSQTSGWEWKTKYEYRVKAVNELGAGVASASLVITTSVDPSLCTVPTGMGTISLEDVQPLNITISWSELTTTSLNGGDIPIFYQVEFSTDNVTYSILNTDQEVKVLQYSHIVEQVFGSGVTVFYRVRAMNNVGMGTNASKPLAVKTSKVPQDMGSLKAGEINPLDITISWSALTLEADNGGDVPIFYQVEWSPNNLNWTVLNEGGPFGLSYTHVKSEPFTPDTYQYYRVLPWNRIGKGIAYSTALKVLADDYPSGMSAISLNQTNPTNITIKWAALTSTTLNGRDLPIFYSVEVKSSLDTTWTVLNDGGELVFEYMYAPGFVLNENATYQFRVRPKNRVGISPTYSSVLTVISDKRPQYMNTPTVWVQNTQYNTIKWAELTDMQDNGGDIPTIYLMDYSAEKATWYTLNDDGLFWLNYSSWPGTILTKKAYYRVRAMNGVGLAYIYSNILTVTQTANHSANHCEANPSNQTICFSEAGDMWGSGAYPTLYQLEWLNPITYGNTCDNVPTSFRDDASNPTTKPNMLWKVVSPKTGAKSLYLQHSLLPGALPDSTPGIFPLNIFPSGSVQCYRVRMYLNGAWAASPSSITRAWADQVPYGMNVPELVEVNPYNITLSWKELTTPDNGRDMPIFYQLEWYDYTLSAWVGLLSKAVNGKILKYTHVRNQVYNATQTLQYRLIAENGVGMGTVYSDILEVNPDTEPLGMDSMYIVSIEPYTIVVGWPELTPSLNGGDQPYYYELEWYNDKTQAWVKMINNETKGIVLTFNHTVTGDYFPPNTYQQYRVTPKNLVGWGKETSPILQVLTDTFPNAPQNLAMVSIDPKAMAVQWTDQVYDGDTGRDPVTFFQLDWDQGTNATSWITLTGKLTTGRVTNFTLTQAQVFTPNSFHIFQVRSLNVIGNSPYSTQLTLQADGPPTRMNVPTALTIEPKQVVLKWNKITSQADTGRDPVIYYKLEFLVRPCYADWAADCIAESMSLASWLEITKQDVQYANNTFTHTFTSVLKPDENFFYRVCPMNGVGLGTCSDNFAMLSDTTPTFMNPPVVASENVYPSWMVVTWTGIFTDMETGRDPIVFYDLQYDNGTNKASWVSLMNETAGLVYTFNHSISGIFPNGGNVNYRLRAKNNVGFGVYSTVTTVLCDSTPSSMNAPVVNIANNVNPLWIQVSWSPMTDCLLTGRDCPKSYGLEWDQGNDTWVNLTTPSMGLITKFNVTFASAYSSGHVFKFKGYAQNGVGFGSYSTVLSVTGDKVPQFMNVPILLQVYPTWITLEWQPITLTSQTGGDQANYYELEWDQGANNTWLSVYTPATQPLLVTTFNVSSPDNTPFESGQLINFRLRARNGIGYGAYSSPALVTCDKVPQTMYPPYIQSQEIDVDPFWIKLYWNELLSEPENGYDTVKAYGLEWDQGNGTWVNVSTWVNGTSVRAYSGEQPFPSGSSQKFRTYAINGVGQGVRSAETEVVADKVPQYMNTPFVEFQYDFITPHSILVEWNGIIAFALTGGDPVIYYELQWDQGLYDEEISEESQESIWKSATTQLPTLQYSHNLTVVEPFSSNSTQRFRVRGWNKVGAGEWSQILAVQTDLIPQYMNAPVIDESDINPTWIFVTWTGIEGNNEYTGGDSPDYYGLEWDQGNDTWVNVTNEEIGLVTQFNFTRTEPFPSGKNLSFRLYAKNGVGYGAYSQVTIVTADSVPLYMYAPQVSEIHPRWIYISWDAILDYVTETGRDEPTYYGLEWDQGINLWENLTHIGMGKINHFNLTSRDNKPFPSGMLIKLRTYAKNGVGYGAYSEVTTIIADKVPQYMNAPQVDYESNHINPTWIFVTWSIIEGDEQAGGDDVTYYGLEWDQGNDTWKNVTKTSDGLLTAFNLTTPSPPFCNGCQLKLRSYAKNGVGYGVYSAVTTITTDSVPLFMIQPSVEHVQITPDWIFVTWSTIEGDDKTGGDEVSFYGLEWDQGNNTWENVTKASDGLLTSFNITTSNPPFCNGCQIKLRTYAKNGVGYGVYSSVTTIVADSVPLFMSSPQVDHIQITPEWIFVTWSLIEGDEETGGDDVIFYGLEWDQMNGTWANLTKQSQGLVTQYNLSAPVVPFCNGCQIKFRAFAKNGVGYGVYSTVTTITADSVPLFMSQPQIDYESNHINPTWIFITWSPILGDDQTGGDDATYYGLEWDQANGTWANITKPSQGMVLQYNLSAPTPPFASNCTIKFRAYAKNGVGYGAYSVVKQIQADSIPLFMAKPTVNYNANHINPKWIYITWGTINGDSETGGDIANHYGIEWDQGNGTWLRLTMGTEGLIQSYNLTSLSAPFASNMTIKLRAIARNGVGYGAYSAVHTINADSIPLRMNSPVQTQVDYNQIMLSWAPISSWADTGGDAITYYQLLFNSISCYSLNESLPCPPNQLDNWVSLTTESTPPPQTFYSHTSPTHFSRDRLFQYKICAKNGVGMGACSSVTEILTDTIPVKMGAPSVQEVVHDQITLSWPGVNGFDETGRSPVIRYKVQWDAYQWYYGKDAGALNGTNVTWKDCGTVAHDDQAERITFVHENLPNFIQKRKIHYRVQAINNVGEGPWSDPVQTKTKNRYWSKARSWPSGAVPVEGQDVLIPQGQNFTFDLPLSPVYKRVDVNGQLEFQEDAPSLNLQAYAIFIKTGDFWIGSSKLEPFQGKATITLYGNQLSQNYTIDSETYGGNKLLVNYGMLRAYGLKRIRLGRLIATANPGDTILHLQPGLSWQAGDKIGIAPSDMRYSHSDYALISTYNNVTGDTTLDRAISYYHYGKSTSTESAYNGIDMRTEVYLLSRNILIQGSPIDGTLDPYTNAPLPPWGCQIVTSQLLEGFSVRKGQTFLDNVEIANCSQYGGNQAAVRFEDSQAGESVVSNSVLRHGEGLGVHMETCRSIRFVNNTIFDFGKYGMNISSCTNLTIDANHISTIKDFQLTESPLSEKQPAGILGCIESDCTTVSITNNVVSGVSYAGYIAVGHECGSSGTQTLFKNNIAHSINGWGAVIFSNMKSFTQQQICVEASYFTAYKCSQGGIIMYNATLTVMFSQMTLIDNQIGGTIMMVGSTQFENNTQLAVFRDSIFYGETEARDCKAQDACYGASADKRECFDRNGLYVSYFSTKGKAPLTNRLYELPLQKIQSDATYGGESEYRNLTFVNFKNTITYCGKQQAAIALNPTGADYHPRAKFVKTTFINQHEDALAFMFSPPVDWIDFKLCGIDPCSGPINTLLQFENTTYSGSLKPTATLPRFQITPANTRVSGKYSTCSYMKAWNAYQCQNNNLGILLFESRDADNRTRMVSPVTVTSREYQTKTQLEAFMSHQEIIVTQVERLSRFPALVQTGANPKYDLEYDTQPPQRQRFTLIADNGALTARIHYPKAAAYILRDKSGNQIPANTWDDEAHDQKQIEGAFCGENRFDVVNNILEFYITPNCTIWIEGVNVIMTNVRLNWTLTSFYQSGGATTFKNNLASSLDIQPSFIKVLQVKQGSVIVDFQIYQAQEDKKFQKSGGLEAVKTNLYNQIQDQTIWLGAPILNATVVGKAAIIVKTNNSTSSFERPQDWNATGKEVWVNQPTVVEDKNTGKDSDNPLVQTEVKEVKEDTKEASKSFAIVIGVILAVLVTFCFVGYMVYRRYKRREDEKQQSTGKVADYITQSGSSPLKNGDVTSFDEEAGSDEQFHPSQMFNSQDASAKDFKSVRKHMESDRLMLQSSERKTREGFFNENNGPQATFGQHQKEGNSSDEEEEEANSEFEKISDFDIDENEIEAASVQPQNANPEPEINLEDYEGEIGNFEEEFEMKEEPIVQHYQPPLTQQVNAKVAPEEVLVNNINQQFKEEVKEPIPEQEANAPEVDDDEDFDLQSESEEPADEIGNLSGGFEEPLPSDQRLQQSEEPLQAEEEVKIQGLSEAMERKDYENDDDYSSIDMGSDEDEQENNLGKENENQGAPQRAAPLENNLVNE